MLTFFACPSTLLHELSEHWLAGSDCVVIVEPSEARGFFSFGVCRVRIKKSSSQWQSSFPLVRSLRANYLNSSRPLNPSHSLVNESICNSLPSESNSWRTKKNPENWFPDIHQTRKVYFSQDYFYFSHYCCSAALAHTRDEEEAQKHLQI